MLAVATCAALLSACADQAANRRGGRTARPLVRAAAGAFGQHAGAQRLVEPVRRPGAHRLDRARAGTKPDRCHRPRPGVCGPGHPVRGGGAERAAGQRGGQREPRHHRPDHSAGHLAQRGPAGFVGRWPLGREQRPPGQRAGAARRGGCRLARSPGAGGFRTGAALFFAAPVPRTARGGPARPRFALVWNLKPDSPRFFYFRKKSFLNQGVSKI